MNKNQNADNLVEIGNKLFSNEKYFLAVKSYSFALNIDNKNMRAYLNQAAANLKIDRYYQAYLSARKAWALSSGKAEFQNQAEKALFRMGKASYFMREYEKSARYYSQCLDLNPANKEADEELGRSKRRLNESVTGIYDMKDLIEKHKNGDLRFDVADYNSPDIKVVEVATNCKGVIAVNSIKKGTLLVVSKAVSIAYNKELNAKKFVLNINHFTRRHDSQAQMQSFTNLIQKMQSNFKLAKQIYSLYPGR